MEECFSSSSFHLLQILLAVMESLGSARTDCGPLSGKHIRHVRSHQRLKHQLYEGDSSQQKSKGLCDFYSEFRASKVEAPLTSGL